MIWTDSPCWITCWNDSNSYIKALQQPKIEFIVAQHPWLENDCLFADLILPVTTKFEERRHRHRHHGRPVLPRAPRGAGHRAAWASRYSDYEIVCEVAERFGLLEEYTGGKSVEELIEIGFDGLRRART